MRAFVTGKPIPGRPHPAITMFALCDNMKWNHLPVAGGLYDQDPDLLEKFRFIFNARNEYQAKKMKDDERKSKQGASRARRPIRRRR